MGVFRRAELTASNLAARLEGKAPARLRPRAGRTLDRRANLELALRRSLLVLRRHNLRDVDKLRGK
jgi:hypothetical protein